MLSIAALCNLRGYINRLTLPVAAVCSFAIILSIVVLTNALAQWIYHGRHWSGWSGRWLLRDFLIFSVLAGIALRYLYVQQQWLHEQSATHSARLDALHARIRPHFLFNSLNTIASLIRFAPAEAETAVEDLAALMRANLSSRHLFNEWQQELEICKAYERIEQLRLGERLRVDWQVDAMPGDLMVPPLVLQPLLENAIYHGIEKQPEGGVVVVAASLRDGVVHIEISNPLLSSAVCNAPELSLSLQGPDAKASEQAVNGRHNGVALANIRARLASLYRDPVTGRDNSGLQFSERSNHFIARLSIPLAAAPNGASRQVGSGTAQVLVSPANTQPG